MGSCVNGCHDLDYGEVEHETACTCTAEQLVAGIERFNKLGISVVFVAENRVDEYGYEHWHEVPATGQFRLKSMCVGCDKLADSHA